MNGHERREFVRSHRTAIFGYGRRDHGPAMTAVYYVMDGDDLLVSTMAARAKARAMPDSTRQHVEETVRRDDVEGLTHSLGASLAWDATP